MKKNMMILSIAGSLLLSLAGCSSMDSIDDGTVITDGDKTPTGNVATIYTTTSDGYQALNMTKSEIMSGVDMAPTTIQIDPSKTYQSMDGFGFAITYSTCYNLLKMEPAARAEFLKKTYSVGEGYGVSYARISIGCNDFSSKEYTLCDEEGLENFRMYKDETDYVIPILKEILAINPDLKIIAAPWTCPKWMKVNDIEKKEAYDSWTDGHLNPDYYGEYAKYFVKFVQEMKKQGIDIYAVSPQNEPLNKANCASLYMPWQEEAPFVKELAAAFKQNGITTKIYLYDHNYNYGNLKDQEDYPVKIYDALGNNYDGSELVVGAAYHDYGGNNSELTDIFTKAPDKELIFSESSIGKWNNGRDLTERLIADMKNITLGTVNQQCKAVLVWNLMLDEKMGPNLDGGCQTCYGAVDIYNNYTRIKANSHYYIITHMSSVVRTGATRIGTTQRSVTQNLLYSAFVNPDGSKAIVITNSGDDNKTITVSDGNNYFKAEVPAQGVVSCNWK